MGEMDKASVRAAVRAVLQHASLPDLDNVMEQLAEGIDSNSPEQYAIVLTQRADDLLQKLIQSVQELAPPIIQSAASAPVLADDFVTDSVRSLLDEMYPRVVKND